jgi:hypothetical protein
MPASREGQAELTEEAIAKLSEPGGVIISKRRLCPFANHHH